MLWFFTHRPARLTRPQARRFTYLCAASPFVINLAVLYLRREDGSPLFFGAWMLVAGIIFGLTQLDRIPSRTSRRIRSGLCPNCAYDLRATPQPLPRVRLPSLIDSDRARPEGSSPRRRLAAHFFQNDPGNKTRIRVARQKHVSRRNLFRLRRPSHR